MSLEFLNVSGHQIFDCLFLLIQISRTSADQGWERRARSGGLCFVDCQEAHNFNILDVSGKLSAQVEPLLNFGPYLPSPLRAVRHHVTGFHRLQLLYDCLINRLKKVQWIFAKLSSSFRDVDVRSLFARTEEICSSSTSSVTEHSLNMTENIGIHQIHDSLDVAMNFYGGLASEAILLHPKQSKVAL